MENNVKAYIDDDDEVIDLKELILFVLRKWRVLIILGMIGVVLGAGFGLLKRDRTVEDIEDISELHLKEIEQYAQYQQFYENQLAYEEESVYLNIDPSQAYTASKVYLMRVNEVDAPVIGELYRSILRDSHVYDELIEASGLDCTQRAIKELVSIGFSRLDEEEPILFWIKQQRNIEVSIYVVAPTEESCQSMMRFLDERVGAVTARANEKYEIDSSEILVDACNVGYNSSIETARAAATEKRGEYINQLSTLEKTLTEDDILYYNEIYDVEENDKEKGLSWLKWALVIGVVFGCLGVGVYAVIFVMDGHVKSADDLQAYGLHIFACVEESTGKKKKANWIDRLLMVKRQYNTMGYLVNALKVLDRHPILLSGDREDADTVSVLKKIQEMDTSLMVSSMLTTDEAAQMLVKEAEGVVLLVHLWKTKRAELEQEIRICQKIGRDVIGVIVIG